MAQFIRTKKLTNSAYSPTLAISEATRRAEVDGSIQEIADILYSNDSGKGASQVGLQGGAYPTVQALSEAVQASQTGFIPIDGSVTNNKLATDVKVGSLATLLTTVKTSVVGAINELLTTTTITITSGFASGWSGTVTIRKSFGNLVQIMVDVTKSTDMVVGDESILTIPVGTRPLSGAINSVCLLTSVAIAITTVSAYGGVDVNGVLFVHKQGTVTNARRLIFNSMYYSA